MSEALIISLPPPKKPINWDRWLSGAALVIALGAAIFSGLQYRASDREATAAELQVKIAQGARDDAKQAAKEQAADVERSRKAAEASATAAKALADGMQRSASAAEASAKAGNESLQLSRQAMVLSEQPLLETVQAQLLKPLVVGEMIPLSVQTINSGKGPAKTVEILQSVNASAKWEFDFRKQTVSRTALLGVNAGSIAKPEITTTGSLSLTQQGVEQIRAGTIHLYIFGIVQYEQPGIEKPTRQSYTYCLYYVPALDKVAQSPFADCPEHPSLPK